MYHFWYYSILLDLSSIDHHFLFDEEFPLLFFLVALLLEMDSLSFVYMKKSSFHQFEADGPIHLLSTWKIMFHFCCIVCILLIRLLMRSLKIWSLFFDTYNAHSLVALKDFFFIICFQQFDYDMAWCDFLCVYTLETC